MRASDSSVKIGGAGDLQVKFDNSVKDRAAPNFDPNADPLAAAARQSIKFNQRLADDIKADKDANNGDVSADAQKKADPKKVMATHMHVLAHDGIVPVQQSQHQLQALAQVHSRDLQPATQREPGLQNLNIRHFDNTQRA